MYKVLRENKERALNLGTEKEDPQAMAVSQANKGEKGI